MRDKKSRGALFTIDVLNDKNVAAVEVQARVYHGDQGSLYDMDLKTTVAEFLLVLDHMSAMQ